jgi:hypothetical protein
MGRSGGAGVVPHQKARAGVVQLQELAEPVAKFPYIRKAGQRIPMDPRRLIFEFQESVILKGRVSLENLQERIPAFALLVKPWTKTMVAGMIERVITSPRAEGAAGPSALLSWQPGGKPGRREAAFGGKKRGSYLAMRYVRSSGILSRFDLLAALAAQDANEPPNGVPALFSQHSGSQRFVSLTKTATICATPCESTRRSPRSRANLPMRRSISPRCKLSAPAAVGMVGCCGSSRRTCARPQRRSASVELLPQAPLHRNLPRAFESVPRCASFRAWRTSAAALRDLGKMGRAYSRHIPNSIPSPPKSHSRTATIRVLVLSHNPRLQARILAPLRQRRPVKVAFPVRNQTCRRATPVRPPCEGVQHRQLAGRIELEDHTAAGWTYERRPAAVS